MWDFIKVYLPITLLVVAGFIVAWQFVDPAPPRVITIATGASDGAYTQAAERYRDVLAETGITLVVKPTAGAGENLRLLTDPQSGVDVAFVQGGIGDPFGAPELVSLASVFLEPLWVFVRADEVPDRLISLKGKRIAIGVPGSGTRVLAKTLLVASGVDDENSEFRSIGGAEAAAALKAGEVDAAFFVSARLSPTMRGLIRDPELSLLGFTRAEAYKRLYRYLTRVTVPEGVLALDLNLPPRDLELVAPTAALVAREDLHPALVDLLLGAAARTHQQGDLFSPPDTFPSPNYVDFPLSEDARRYFKSGPTFLRRVLPFGVAVLVERLLILLVPLLTLMIPLFRIAPPIYRWRMNRKIYRWYKKLREIEVRGKEERDDENRERLLRELEELQRQAGQVKVPLAYAEHLYHLRLHIAFIRQRLEGKEPAAPAEGQPQGA